MKNVNLGAYLPDISVFIKTIPHEIIRFFSIKLYLFKIGDRNKKSLANLYVGISDQNFVPGPGFIFNYKQIIIILMN